MTSNYISAGSFFFFFFFKFIDLFGCAGSQLWHVGSLVAACGLLVAACGIQFPDQGLNLAPCIGSAESQPLDHQESSSAGSFSLLHCLQYFIVFNSIFQNQKLLELLQQKAISPHFSPLKQEYCMLILLQIQTFSPEVRMLSSHSLTRVTCFVSQASILQLTQIHTSSNPRTVHTGEPFNYMVSVIWESESSFSPLRW